MARLLRVHFASIGYRGARLAPLTLDFRQGTGTGADSVVWLRNGGGKSSILSLFFSVFRPAKREFLGATADQKKRSLDQFVRGPDVSFVLTEWDVAPTGQLTLLGTTPTETRVVGQVLAWRGGRASRDTSLLRRGFFAFKTSPDVALEDLPVDGFGEHARSFEAFREWLRDLQLAAPGIEVEWSENQTKWLEHLRSIHIDPELFRYQLGMNVREGAADEQFSFNSALHFVEFLLDLAFDPASADEVSKVLEAQRSELAQRPRWVSELAFIDAAVPRLEELVTALEQRAKAAEARTTSKLAAAALVAALNADATSKQGEVEALGELRLEVEEQARQAKARMNNHGRWAQGLGRLSRDLAVEEARAALESAKQDLASAGTHMKLVVAARALHVVRSLNLRREEKQRALDIEQRQLAPMVERLRSSGSQLVAALTKIIGTVEDRRRAGEARLETLRVEHEATDQARAALQTQLGGLEEEQKAIRSRLSERDAERSRLRSDGILESREEVIDAQLRWRERKDRCSADLAALEATLDALDTERTAIGARRVESSAAMATEEQDAKSFELRHLEGCASRDRIQAEPRMLEALSSDQVAIDHPGLESLLREEAARARRLALRSAVDGAEDARSLDSLREQGLLPAPRSAEVVAEAIRMAGGSAMPATRWIAENAPASGEATRWLQSDPARFGAVVVQGSAGPSWLAQLEPARARIREPVALIAPTLESQDTRHSVVMPVEIGTHDHPAAVAARDRIEQEVHSRAERESELRLQEEELLGIAGDIRSWLATYGEGRLGGLETAAETHRLKAAAIRRELGALDERDREIEQEKSNASTLLDSARKGERRAESALKDLVSFNQRVERKVASWRQRLEEVVAALADAAQRLPQLESELRGLTEAIASHRDAVRACEQERTTLETERGGVKHVADGPSPPIDVVAARERYRTQLAVYEQRLSGSQLRGELQELDGHLQSARQDLDRHCRDLDRATVGSLLDATDVPLEQLQDDAEAAKERAGARVGACEQALKSAVGQRDAGAQRRESADLPRDEEAPETAQQARAASDRHFRLQAEAAAEANQHNDTLRNLERDRSEHQKMIERRERQVQVVTAGVGDLPGALESALPPGDVDAVVAATVRKFKEADEAAHVAGDAVIKACEVVRTTASSDDFAPIEGKHRTVLTAPVDALAPNAPRYLEGLIARREVMRQRLEDLDRNRGHILASVERVTSDAISLLHRAERASRLPEALGRWGGRPFLRVAFEVPPTPEERQVRLEPLVDRIVQEGRIPGGMELTRRGVEELAGTRGFSVTILKPDPSLPTDRVPIEESGGFSGAERLTVAVLLYCTLAQMRAWARGSRRSREDAGVLLLDNPMGTCSSVRLLDLQRAVAREMRVQLVYTTGVRDLDALSTMPNVVRLRNSHRDVTTGNLHVTHQDRNVEGVRIVESHPR